MFHIRPSDQSWQDPHLPVQSTAPTQLHSFQCFPAKHQKLCIELLNMSAVKLLLKLLIPLSAIFLALVYYKRGFACSCPIVESFTPPCKDYELASPAYPRVTSWKTWFHPSQSWEASNTEPPKKDWNLLRHLGGNGPWVEHVGGNKGPLLGESNQSDTLSLAPPEGCLIDQVHMVCEDDLCRSLSQGEF